MKHLEESHKHLEDEQDMDAQLEREFAEKQEIDERRELCLALQLDQECQRKQKPLTKVSYSDWYKNPDFAYYFWKKVSRYRRICYGITGHTFFIPSFHF